MKPKRKPVKPREKRQLVTFWINVELKRKLERYCHKHACKQTDVILEGIKSILEIA